MIDDVGISLDKGRKDKLVSHLAGLGQVFLTSTDPDFIQDGHKIFL
jgi:recombinational DNA repair ATPase RecF